jgi:pimeloyl-ACP methyl ester carboxylesterase
VKEPAVKHVSRDGVRLAYVEGGAGDPPVVLVHGMLGTHRLMTPLFDHLVSDHRVVSLDLRGHGGSDKPRGDYGNEVFAHDFLALFDQLSLLRPVVVGHSFGGSVLLYLAAQYPGSVGGLVLLDSGVRSAAARVAELGPPSEAVGTAPTESTDFFLTRLFGPDDPPAMRDKCVEEIALVPTYASSAMQRTVVGFDAASAAARCTVPALFILADNPFTDRESLDRLGPNWRIGKVVGSGHFIQLVVPDQVNAMIDRFLALLPAS